MISYLKSIEELRNFMLSSKNGDTFYYCYQKYIVNDKSNWEAVFKSKSYINDISLLETNLVVKKLETKIAVCGILQFGNRFVSVKRKDNDLFGFIGGKVDKGEALNEALIRETKEETGFNVTINYAFSPFVKEDDGYLVFCYLLFLSKNHTDIKEGEVPYLYLLSKQQLITESPYSDYNREAFQWYLI